jgi:hypothetical protein
MNRRALAHAAFSSRRLKRHGSEAVRHGSGMLSRLLPLARQNEGSSRQQEQRDYSDQQQMR